MTNTLIEKIATILLILFISISLYGQFHYLLPWHKDLPAITYNHSSTYVIVNWYDTETELQTALDDNELAGLSECEHRPDFNTSFCELWLVLPEHYEDDYAFDTIGHEFCHALRGDDCHVESF